MGIPEELRLRIQAAGKKPRQATVRDLCTYTAPELCQVLGRSDARELTRLHLKPLREAGVLTLLYPESEKHRTRLTAPWVLKAKRRRCKGAMPEQTANLKSGGRRVKFGDVVRLSEVRSQDLLADAFKRYVVVGALQVTQAALQPLPISFWCS